MNESIILLLKTVRDEFLSKISTMQEMVPRECILPDTNNFIQVIIGMRRSGKTFFLFQQILKLLHEKIALEQILYLNFEDDRLLPMGSDELAQILEAYYSLYPENHKQLCYFFLDEIQNVDNWPLVIRRFQDSKKVKIILTGSSAKLLSKEIGTSLRGRALTQELWPYSFREYCLAKELPYPSEIMPQSEVDHYAMCLKNYFLEGGFPAVLNLENSIRRDILQNYVDTVIFRDIIERHAITNISLIKYLVKSMVKYSAAEYSPNKFFNDLKSQGFSLSKNTVYDYMDHIEDAFLAFRVPLYSESLRKTQVNPKKIYAVDTGLVTAYSMSLMDNFGKMFETVFYLDLRRRGDEIYYYKTKSDYEIDFFTKDRQGKLHLYQIAWALDNPETLLREKRALEEAEKELGIKGELIDMRTYLSLQSGTFLR